MQTDTHMVIHNIRPQQATSFFLQMVGMLMVFNSNNSNKKWDVGLKATCPPSRKLNGFQTLNQENGTKPNQFLDPPQILSMPNGNLINEVVPENHIGITDARTHGRTDGEHY